MPKAGAPVTARDTRYQAAVVEAGRLLLLFCVPRGVAGLWVLPGGGREAGRPDVNVRPGPRIEPGRMAMATYEARRDVSGAAPPRTPRGGA